MQWEIQEMLGRTGFQAAQESLNQMVAQTSKVAETLGRLQFKMGAPAVVEQLQAYAKNAAAIQSQFITMVDGIDWNALMDVAEEEERARLDEESKSLRGLLFREYQNLNEFVLKFQAFLETLYKKSPILFFALNILIWKPFTDSLSDAVIDGTRTIITQAHHVIFDEDMRSKTVRKKAAAGLSSVDPLLVNAIRIILKPELELRAKATRQSKVVITLALGQKVRFIETRGDWTQIESYDAATDTFYTGWVYTRYLAKVEK